MLINPAGGQGKSVGDFEKFVRPLFDLADIKTDLIITGKPQWCTCKCTCIPQANFLVNTVINIL